MNTPRRRRRIASILTILSATVCQATAFGQLPKPRLQSVFPSGSRRGETVEIQLVGTDLEGVDALWFDHPTLRAFRVAGGKFRVAVGAEAPIGHHDVRAVGPLGASNPRTFVVGDAPEKIRLKTQADAANPASRRIAINSVVNGRLDAPGQIDEFTFEGKKGQRVFLEVEGERIDSRIDATLVLADPSGRVLQEAQDDQGLDPLLDATLPRDGAYTVRVQDVTFAGSSDHVYRLILHEGPRIDAVFPAVVARDGSEANLTLIGRGLGGEPIAGASIDGRPIEKARATWKPTGPLDSALNAGGSTLTFASILDRRGFEYRFHHPSGRVSNPVFLAEAVAPIVLEKEPNDETRPQSVTPPCEIAGFFDKPADFDAYRFSAKQGEVWWVQADSERIGASADVNFTIRKIPPQGPPQDLVNGEDYPDFVPDFRLPTNSPDAAVRFQAPENGTYEILLSDLYSARRGDVRLGYRLTIRKEKADAIVSIVPFESQTLDSVNVRAGSKTPAFLVAKRLDGYNGPIRVEARELPEGVTCPSVFIGPGQVVAPLVFEAKKDAKETVGTVRLVSSIQPGDSKTRIEREVLASSMVWPPSNGPSGPLPPPVRLTRGFVIAVRGPLGFGLDVQPSVWKIGQGHALPLSFQLDRLADMTEGVQVVASDLPPNFPAPPPALIAKGARTLDLPLYVPKNVPPGNYSFLFRGNAPVPFNKDPNAKDRPNVNVMLPSNPIVLEIAPAPANLSVNAQGGVVSPGGKLDLLVTIARQNGSTGPLTLSLVAPSSSKLSATSVVIPGDKNTGTLTIRAANDASPGAVANVYVRATAAVGGSNVETDEPTSLTIQKK